MSSGPPSLPQLDGAHLPELLDDLEAAMRELVSTLERHPERWPRVTEGAWSAGQHVEHVGHVLAIGADALERASLLLLRGDLPPPPWRDPIQALFVYAAMRRFPRGGRAPSGAVPGAKPDRARAFARIAQGMLRHRALSDGLTIEQRDRLWIWNPYVPWLRWHYRFAEEVRVQTTHAFLHARHTHPIG